MSNMVRAPKVNPAQLPLGLKFLDEEIRNIDPEEEKKERDRKAQEKREETARCEAVKKRVFALEKNNRDRLYVFYSGKNWHKMGGKSALYYAHILAPRLDRDVDIRVDKDFYYKFKEGVCSLSDMPRLKKDMAKLGVKVIAEDEDVTVFDLGRRISDQELEAAYSIDDERRKQINTLVGIDEDHTYARIAQMQRQIAQQLRAVQNKGNKADRDFILTDIARRSLKSLVDIMEISNNLLMPVETLREVYIFDRRLEAYLQILMEQGLFKKRETLELELKLSDVCQLINKEIKKAGGKTIEEIINERKENAK